MSGFGRRWRDEWSIEPGAVYLNHGTVGAPPRRVLRAQQAIRDEIERHPARFLLRELAEIRIGGPRSEPPRMRAAAAAVAPRFGARGEDVVFVDNATTGANAVLGSFPLAPGDELLVTDLGYGGVTNAARYFAQRSGARLVEAHVPFPGATPERTLAAIAASLTPATRLALVDHVASESGLVLPIAEIATLCRERGVALLVDGAHAPGAVPLDIPAVGADYYVANLHKWAWTPRPCGILWAPPERRAGLHPPAISWGLDQDWTTEFDWLGTRDPSAWLAAPAALDYLEEVGVEAVLAWNHGLVWRAARRLAERWGVDFDTPAEMVGPMATLALPAPLGGTPEDAARLRDALLFEEGIEAQVHARDGRLWTRLAAQIYNDLDDFDRLGEAVARRAGGA